ncbi:helix-turn-helix domain-containing protein [Pseudomonas sp. LA5]|uniref:helix-turn-helix domain-containing protein n=1 Tax=Pseudomonas sp. LA5 TaxID=3027850 RepID=UPI00235F4CF2|nr:helix-turn-helix transcriptional regulator [Pseudomonas sp. LA5]
MIVVGEWKGLLGKGLAPRELECVLGLASGLTHKQIARDMSIAPMTVTKRVSSAMFKLGVQRAPQLVAEAMKRQIISPLCIALMALIASHSFLDEDPMRRDRRAPERRIAQVRVLRRAEAPDIYA